LLFKISSYQETNLFNFLSQFTHLTATFGPNNGGHHQWLSVGPSCRVRIPIDHQLFGSS